MKLHATLCLLALAGCATEDFAKLLAGEPTKHPYLSVTDAL